MARVVFCPSCQSRGSIPDGGEAARIRCPKCGQTFDIKGAAQSASGTINRLAAAASCSPRPATSAIDDREHLQPLPSLSYSGSRRAPAAYGQPVPSSGSGQYPLLYAAIGIGGLGIVSLAVALAVVLSRGNGEHAVGKPAQKEVVQDDAPVRRASRGGSGFSRDYENVLLGQLVPGIECEFGSRWSGNHPPPERGDGLSQAHGRGPNSGVWHRLRDRGARRHRHSGDQSTCRRVRPLRFAAEPHGQGDHSGV